MFSDGWDRTTQIVSLVKIISDPNYRTFEGFERLILRDWVEFGHKFNDRNGVTSTDTNERSPVFMQFIDAVHQLWLKNPDAFEFNQRYLVHCFFGRLLKFFDCLDETWPTSIFRILWYFFVQLV